MQFVLFDFSWQDFFKRLQVLVSYFLRFFLSLLMVISLALIYGSFILPSFNDQSFSLTLRWPEPIYVRVGYVFESRSVRQERFNRFQ